MTASMLLYKCVLMRVLICELIRVLNNSFCGTSLYIVLLVGRGLIRAGSAKTAYVWRIFNNYVYVKFLRPAKDRGKHH